MTPAKLLALADDYDRQADEAHARGDMAAMLRLFAAATELRAAAQERERLQGRGLPASAPPVNVQEMTAGQIARRGQAIAESKASSPLHAAAALDQRFRSLRGWARVRKIGRSSASDYAIGTAPAPAWVDKIARKDFPTVFAKGWNWPKGVKP